MRAGFSRQLLLLSLRLNFARQNIRIGTRSAFAAVGAVTDDLIRRAFAGLEILIGVAPGIGGDGFDEIGDEDFEAFLRVGEAALLQVIGVEGGRISRDVGAGAVFFRTLE